VRGLRGGKDRTDLFLLVVGCPLQQTKDY
jgi:hypothetical protein